MSDLYGFWVALILTGARIRWDSAISFARALYPRPSTLNRVDEFIRWMLAWVGYTREICHMHIHMIPHLQDDDGWMRRRKDFNLGLGSTGKLLRDS